jgi:hypothetical protein
MQRRLLATFAALTLTSCATIKPPIDTLDAAARDYVVLQLASARGGRLYRRLHGDACSAPGRYAGEGKRSAALTQAVHALSRGSAAAADNRRACSVDAAPGSGDPPAHAPGERLPFVEEAQGLFGCAGARPSSAYDPVLARIETLVPGPGSLAERVEAIRPLHHPARQAGTVFRTAIAACRAATVEHISLPPTERFDLAFVTGKSWMGYNYYLGDYKADRDQHRPADPPGRAIDLGCHEAIPGIMCTMRCSRNG